MKSQAELHAMMEVDTEILHYVRESQRMAPVTVDSVHNYLTNIRRRRLERSEADDRLADLVDEEKLAATEEWVPGEGKVKFYRVTAKGRDVLDGMIPPGA